LRVALTSPSLPMSCETLMTQELLIPEGENGVHDVGHGETTVPVAVRGAKRPVPDPELVEHAKRRRFIAEYKLRVLREADACKRTEDELQKAGKVIEVQGNVSALLGELLEPKGAQGSTER
jgi:hypothetical protein